MIYYEICQVGGKVWNQVRRQVNDEVRYQVGDQVWSRAWNHVKDQVMHQAMDDLRW